MGFKGSEVQILSPRPENEIKAGTAKGLPAFFYYSLLNPAPLSDISAIGFCVLMT
jgi:hypothetical protein